MSLQLASFINRYKITTEKSKMTKKASNVDQNEYNQFGALAQVQSQSRTTSSTNLSTVATVENPVNM